MQANSVNHSFYSTSDSVLDITTEGITLETAPKVDSVYGDIAATAGELTYFRGEFANCMEMYADAATVANYLNQHHEWFRRCAHPMKADPLGENGYALSIGRFGSFGYEVEPKVGLDLLPEDQGVYRIRTIPIPDYEPPGYHVDFRASLELAEQEPVSAASDSDAQARPLTRVDWELDLQVAIHFPRFIHALPQNLIQSTGDRLLQQIVRQVSRRLTYKVQDDFHQTLGIPFPSKKRRKLWH